MKKTISDQNVKEIFETTLDRMINETYGSSEKNNELEKENEILKLENSMLISHRRINISLMILGIIIGLVMGSLT